MGGLSTSLKPSAAQTRFRVSMRASLSARAPVQRFSRDAGGYVNFRHAACPYFCGKGIEYLVVKILLRFAMSGLT